MTCCAYCSELAMIEGVDWDGAKLFTCDNHVGAIKRIVKRIYDASV